jgi:hypothetical protein
VEYVIINAYLHPIALERMLDVPRPSVDLFKRLTPYLDATAVLAVLVVGFVLFASRYSARVSLIAISVLATGDIGLFIANGDYAGVSTSVVASTTPSSASLALLAGSHRIALYNPLVLLPSAGAADAVLGEPDLNIVESLSSIQGYGSIVSGVYQLATDTHSFENFDVDVLQNGLENALDLGEVLTLPVYLAETLPPSGAIPVAGGSAVYSNGAIADSAPAKAPLSSGPWSIQPRSQSTWWLPRSNAIRSLTVVVSATRSRWPAFVDVQLAGGDTTGAWQRVAVDRGIATVVDRGDFDISSVSVRDLSSSSVSIGAVVVKEAGGTRLLLDGALQGSLAAPQWQLAEPIGPFVVFTNTLAFGSAWMQASNSLAPTGSDSALGSVTEIDQEPSGGVVMEVHARAPALLIRAAAWAPGWKVSLTPLNGGSARVVEVRQLSLIEEVRVPKGSYDVRWYYAPNGVIASGIVTVLSGSAIILLFLYLLVDGRRRTRRLGKEIRRGVA